MNNYPLHFKRLFGFVALFALAYAVLEISLANKLWTINNLVHFIPFVGILVLYRLGIFYRPIDFDTHFFYPKNRRNKISLAAIQSIKLTALSNQFNTRFWEITYVSDNLQSMRVLPSVIDDSFVRFIEAVKGANPDVDADIFEFKLHFGFSPGVFWKPTKK